MSLQANIRTLLHPVISPTIRFKSKKTGQGQPWQVPDDKNAFGDSSKVDKKFVEGIRELEAGA